MTPTTMTSSSLNRSGTNGELDRSVDSFLGALVALGGCSPMAVRLPELRTRLAEVSDDEFEKVVSMLDREGAIVMDRGTDGTTVRIASSNTAAVNAPQSLIDRVIGAAWSLVQRPDRIVAIPAIRTRLADVPQAAFERALAAAILAGDLERARGFEGPAVRLARPYAYGMSFEHGMPFAHAVPFAHAMPFTHAVPFAHAMCHPSHIMERAEAFHVATREMARRLWELRGRPYGSEVRDWLDAERMVRESAPIEMH